MNKHTKISYRQTFLMITVFSLRGICLESENNNRDNDRRDKCVVRYLSQWLNSVF